jgi:DNA-binding Lrp family transcriptional regulator
MRLNGNHTATEPPEQSTGRATVGEAAEILGITAEAVRSRVKRGTLKSVKEGSTVYVLLKGNGTNRSYSGAQTATGHDRTEAQSPTEPDRTDARAALVDSLQDQIEYLREQLAEEREARRRADTLLARLTEANASMAGQIRELTAPQRPPDEPEAGAEDAEEVDDRGEHAEAQEGAQEEHSTNVERPTEETARRPWWIRWLGG